MISLLIVDDHPVYRDALHQYLTRRFHPLNVEVFGASTIAEGIEVAQSKNTNWTVLLDLKVPDSEDLFSGIKTFKALSNIRNIAVISGLDEELLEDQCIEAGCEIYISKNNEADYIFQKLLTLMYDEPPEQSQFQLTARQLQILKCIVKGESNKVIAFNFNIKEQTVKIHINAIFKELKVSNRTQAVFKANQLNLI